MVVMETAIVNVNYVAAMDHDDDDWEVIVNANPAVMPKQSSACSYEPSPAHFCGVELFTARRGVGAGRGEEDQEHQDADAQHDEQHLRQPTTRREYRSSTAARYSQPSRVGT